MHIHLGDIPVCILEFGFVMNCEVYLGDNYFD